MKYWKQGFYDEPIEGSVEITDEYWQTLLDGQSEGKEIVEDINGHPILQEHVFTIEEVRDQILSNIRSYDKSEYVNSFSLNGDNIWLDKDLRVSIANTVAIKKDKNILDTLISFGVKSIPKLKKDQETLLKSLLLQDRIKYKEVVE